MGKTGRKERAASSGSGASQAAPGAGPNPYDGASQAAQKRAQEVLINIRILDRTMSPGHMLDAEGLQECTEDCLNSLASDGFFSVEARRAIVRKASQGQPGGIAAVLKAMRRFEDHGYVTELGIQAFGNLCRFELDVASRVVEDGGIQAVIQAMNRHKNHQGVIIHAVWVLECLSQWKTLCPHIIEAGGIRPLVFCIRKSVRSSPDWVWKCCSILTSVCRSSPGAASLVVQEGGLRACCTALRIHGMHPAMKASCNDLLDAMLANVPPEEQEEIRERREAVLVETCAMCGAGASEHHMKNLLACGNCSLAVKYCSKDCQTKDWPNHKLECKINPKTQPAPNPSAPKDQTAKSSNGKTAAGGGAAESAPKQMVPSFSSQPFSPPLFLSVAAEGKAHWQKGADEGMPWEDGSNPSLLYLMSQLQHACGPAPPSASEVD